MDADFSHDPVALPALRSALENADLVLGSRYIRGGSAAGQPVWRRALSQLGSRYASVVLGLPFRDLTGGFKGFRANVLAALDLQAIQSNGYAFQIEVTYRALLAGFRVAEVPIVFSDRTQGQSKMSRAIVREAVWMVLTAEEAMPTPALPLPNARAPTFQFSLNLRYAQPCGRFPPWVEPLSNVHLPCSLLFRSCDPCHIQRIGTS